MVEGARGRDAASVGEVPASRSFTSPTPSPSVSARMSTKRARRASPPGTGHRASSSGCLRHAPHRSDRAAMSAPSGARPAPSHMATPTTAPGAGRSAGMERRSPGSHAPAGISPNDDDESGSGGLQLHPQPQSNCPYTAAVKRISPLSTPRKLRRPNVRVSSPASPEGPAVHSAP